MKPQITIQNATLDDIDTMFKWGEYNWELWSDEKNKWFSKKSLQKWINHPEDDILLIAKINHQLIGMCITNVIRDWAFCFGLYIDTPYRGKKIGKMLLEETAKKLKKLGINSLGLLVDTKNDKAKRFYNREGFYTGYQFHFMTKNYKEIK